jgi:ferric-dicitrate binding protein FerR (iron transport regulator)
MITRHARCAVLAAFILVAWWLDAPAQTAVGTISQVAGIPRVIRGAQTLSAVTGMAVDLLDKLTTDAASSLTVTFDDNSSVDLSENSVLIIDQHLLGAHKTVITLMGGRLVALVDKALRRAGGSFTVQTPNAFLAVRGTRFKVKYADSSGVYNGPSTEVAVMEGTVAAANRAVPNQTVDVSAGYETVILGNQPPLPPGPIGLAGMGGGGSRGFSGAGPGVAAPPPAPPAPVPPAPPPVSIP